MERGHRATRYLLYNDERTQHNEKWDDTGQSIFILTISNVLSKIRLAPGFDYFCSRSRIDCV